MATMLIVIQIPCLNEVLCELSGGQQRHLVRDQLDIVLGKLLELNVYSAHLNNHNTFQYFA